MTARKTSPQNQKPSGSAARFLILGLLAFAVLGCQRAAKKPPEPTFYFWKTTLEIAPAERRCLDSLGCKMLFVKVLDIGKNPATGEPEPLAHLEIGDANQLADLKIAPCVFLTNEVFERLAPEKSAALAQKIARAIVEIAARFPAENQCPAEVQFDCDWTATTRAAYFFFLKKMRENLPHNTQISATVRLHQFKFPAQTGVPPADRAMLMLYNTSDIESPEAGNSILSIADLRKYLNGAPRRYPLPTDVALPIFSWAVVLRDGDFWKILPGCNADFFTGNVKFKPLTVNTFEVLDGTFVEGFYLRAGDVVRAEGISPSLLHEAAVEAGKIDEASDVRVAFFHLDSATLYRFSVENLRAACAAIGRDANTSH